MKLSIFKRRRRIRALIVGLGVMAVIVPVAAAAPVAPGQHRDGGTSYVDNQSTQVVGPPSAYDSRPTQVVQASAQVPQVFGWPSGYADPRISPKVDASDVAIRRGGRFPPAGTHIVSGGGSAFQWSDVALGSAIALCIVLACAGGMLATRRRHQTLGV